VLARFVNLDYIIYAYINEIFFSSEFYIIKSIFRKLVIKEILGMKLFCMAVRQKSGMFSLL